MEADAIEEVLPGVADATEVAESAPEVEQENDSEKVDLERIVPEEEQIAHQSAEEVAAMRAAKAASGEDEDVDIFAWANNLFQYKKQLKFDLFLINKNNVLYRAKLDGDIEKQLLPLFIDNMVDYLLNGAGAGMIVRGFEDAESEENVLQRTEWKNVEKLVEVMHWIRTQETEIEVFVEEEHDMKRIKGALLRCAHPAFSKPFYVIKALPTAQILKGDGAWMAAGNTFVPFEAAAALRIPDDNQMVLIENELYVFNQAKLDRLFGYNVKKNSIAEKKVAEIEANFNLSFADGMDMQSLVKGNKAVVNKLQKIDPGSVKQDDLVDHAEELGIDLMLDETGAIIIENTKDLTKFVNLLNDDYIESPLTGIKYEIQRKRPLKKPPKEDGEAPAA